MDRVTSLSDLSMSWPSLLLSVAIHTVPVRRIVSIRTEDDDTTCLGDLHLRDCPKAFP